MTLEVDFSQLHSRLKQNTPIAELSVGLFFQKSSLSILSHIKSIYFPTQNFENTSLTTASDAFSPVSSNKEFAA